MKWSPFMVNVIRMILGIPEAKGKGKTSKYKIKPKMISPDVVVMDMDSFRSSPEVQAQAKAARKSANTYNRTSA